MSNDAFEAMRANRAQAIEQMKSRIAQEKKGSGDDRFWTPPKSQKDGSGNAIIRFLPAPKGEQFAWVKRFTHMWDIPGSRRKFRENCPTTVDANGERRDCPICEANSELWKRIEAGETKLKPTASSRSRKMQMISNIYVISDPERRENEGKVFLYRYGDRIWQKITSKMNPPFQGVKPIDPFDLWEGCDFRLAVRVKDNFPNYDLSEFDSPSKLGGFSEDKLREIYEQEHSLLQFIAPTEFKSWDDIKTNFENATRPPSSPSHDSVSERIRDVEEKMHHHKSDAGGMNRQPAKTAAADDHLGDLDLDGVEIDKDLQDLLDN